MSDSGSFVTQLVVRTELLDSLTEAAQKFGGNVEAVASNPAGAEPLPLESFSVGVVGGGMTAIHISLPESIRGKGMMNFWQEARELHDYHTHRPESCR